jgi:hypothetical protein
VAAAFAVGAAACSTTSGTPSATAPDPQATSIVTPQGSLATLAMGDLSDPENTFWQLLVRPSGSNTWANQVEATAVATNGGIILAAEAGTVEAAARPTNLLNFTPLIATKDGGRSWVSDGLVPSAVAPTPDSLAAGPAGSLAITSAQVVQRATGGRTWSTVATLKDLQDAKACQPTSITAVAYVGNQPAVGVGCAKKGVAGILVRTSGSWAVDGPSVGRSGRAQVLRLQATGSGLTALVQVGNQVLAAWRDATGWTVSPPLPIGDLVSTGPDGGGWFVLGQDLAVHAVAGPGSSWQQLPRVPRGTATMVFDGSTEALAVDPAGTILTVWALSADRARWTETQSLKVPIQFGSSG